ncbi:Unknown protein sequence [Pseudomonas amygdali pv. sesami]|nr:Unknown protein sequence [Pseudomonas amygdali pv. sesami]
MSFHFGFAPGYQHSGYLHIYLAPGGFREAVNRESNQPEGHINSMTAILTHGR